MRLSRGGSLWLLGAAAGLAWTGPAAADETVRGVGVERTIDCAGGEVTISGSSHRLTLRGRCERVVLSGTGNSLHIESLGRLTVSGVNHLVEWQQGLDGSQPRIRKSGLNHRVVQVKGGASSASHGSSGSGQTGASVETGPGGGVVVEGGGSRVTLGADGVTVDPGSNRSGRKDKVVVNTGGATVAVETSGGTIKVGAANAKTGSITVAENNIEQTYNCAGGTATIQGNGNVLTLRNCRDVIVNGTSNTITLQGGVRLIRALGNANEITWSEGVDGKVPNVESLGSGNTVSRSGQ